MIFIQSERESLRILMNKIAPRKMTKAIAAFTDQSNIKTAINAIGNKRETDRV